MINQLAAHADESELGGKLSSALANRLRVTRAEASRLIGDAADLGPRRALTGQPLPPALPATAAAQRDGRIGDAHVRVIRGFWQRLPDDVDIETRVTAEAHLAGLGGTHRPTNSPSSPTGSPTASTPTGTSATSTAPGGAPCSWANKTSTA